MRRLLSVLILSALLTPQGVPRAAPMTETPPPAQVPAEEVAEIRNIILAQIEAFKADDGATAFSFAAPEIRKIFRTPEMFLYMVRRSYPSVYRPRSYTFRPLMAIDGKTVQPVVLVSPTGIEETALYIMEKQPDGLWKIAACIMAQPDGSDT